MRASVLIVDDEAGVRSAIASVLRDEGYEVETVPSGEACLTITQRRAFDAILLDARVRRMYSSVAEDRD